MALSTDIDIDEQSYRSRQIDARQTFKIFQTKKQTNNQPTKQKTNSTNNKTSKVSLNIERKKEKRRLTALTSRAMRHRVQRVLLASRRHLHRQLMHQRRRRRRRRRRHWTVAISRRAARDDRACAIQETNQSNITKI